MDNATPPANAAGADLEPVDDALAAALLAQGDDGARALGLLRDAHQILGDDRYERPAEIAESCVRGAVDALLNLPGSRDAHGKERPGLQGTARNLLKAVDAYQPPDESQPTPISGKGKRRRSRDPAAALQRIRDAADELRPELQRPGGHHRRRAKGVAERVMGQSLGAAQESALDRWGKLYGATSKILHGGASDQARALYQEVLRMSREVFVPLPGRAEQVLQLTHLQHPTESDAATLADWADPRALRYFFLSSPAAAWLPLLNDVLLLPDTTTPNGHWPAAPYLDHLTHVAPKQAQAWLAQHAETVAAAGPDATAAFLRLAARPGIGLAPQVRAIVTRYTQPGREAAATDGLMLRLAADWARDIPPSDRDLDWICTVETLLRAAVHGEHELHQQIHAAAQAATMPDDEFEDSIARLTSARLPSYDTSALLVALLRTAYPTTRRTGPPPTPHSHVKEIRYVLASLLKADVERTDAASLHAVVFNRDLADIRFEDQQAFLGPWLARAVLDLAAFDARAAVPFAQRTEPVIRTIGKADERLRDRLLAAHLDQTSPTRAQGAALDSDATWWEQAITLLPALLAHRPTPEAARLADHARLNCPPERAVELHEKMTATLGTPPGPDELAAYDPEGQARPPRAWLRVWDWSPVLPEQVTTPWKPALTLLRHAKPSGPADPRTADPLFQITDSPPPAIDRAQATAIATEHGPAAAAAALAAASDAGDLRYLQVLRYLIDTDPAAWTTTPTAIIAALALPELRAYYLAVAADQIGHRDTFPDDALAEAAAAALTVHHDLIKDSPPHDDTDDDRTTAAQLAEQAMFDLLTAAWRTDANLPDTPDALNHLYAATKPLASPSTPPSTPAADFVGTDPAGRALHCLLEHAHHHTRTTTDTGLPSRLLAHLDTILNTTGSDPRTAAALGPYLPLLHELAPDWVDAHRATLLTLPPGTITPAAAWLHWGRPHPPLLAALDRAEILHRLRDDTPAETTAHLALALLHNPSLLGDPAALFADIAGADRGPAAASRLLERLAHYTAPQAENTDAAAELWRAALAANLPQGALSGAGAFALTDIDDTTWLDLTLGSATHTPALAHADAIARRAADHADSPAAAQLTALLVANPSAYPWRDAEVRKQARRLLRAISQLPTTADPDDSTKGLRNALIAAGDIDAHLL